MIHVTMHPVCWLVSVDATHENVEEEAKRLIDIILSLLRIHYKTMPSGFPTLGKMESSSIVKADGNSVGVKYSGAGGCILGGFEAPSMYEINLSISNESKTKEFVEKAKLLCDPPDRSLAQRLSQGLGWLTRGRQTKDRSERLLYFFTALESLLSSDDKSAPVVQNIARNAAVILSNDPKERAALASEIKKTLCIAIGLSACRK